MASNIRVGFVTGSGAVLDTVSSVTVTDTRLHAVQSSGVGTFLITGTIVLSMFNFHILKNQEAYFVNDMFFFFVLDIG